MDKEKRKAIEEAGFRVTTVKEFLGLTEEENQLIELKVTLARRIRELRAKADLTQHQLASLLKSSQSRVAKIESADPSVSLELMARAFFVLGGKAANMVKAPSIRTNASRFLELRDSASPAPRGGSHRPSKEAPRHAAAAMHAAPKAKAAHKQAAPTAKPKASKKSGSLSGSGIR
jgi:transcriptional regulator with XRE-family HTH domain